MELPRISLELASTCSTVQEIKLKAHVDFNKYAKKRISLISPRNPTCFSGWVELAKIENTHYIITYRRHYGNLRLWTQHKTYMVVEVEARNPIPLGIG
jgi:hypothetical protein